MLLSLRPLTIAAVFSLGSLLNAADNPFIGRSTHHGESIDPKTVRTEIWATGLRNPWDRKSVV